MVQTFRDRPYAAEHFRRIVHHARAHNPFYREWINDPEDPPLLDRATALQNNDAILNGRAATGTTSGSIGVPFRYYHSPEWQQLARKDADRFVRSLGGTVRCVRIMHSSGESGGPLSLSIVAPVDEQIDFILRHMKESGVVAITTLPTNADLLAQEVIRRGLDMSAIIRFGTYAETLQDHQRTTIQQAFPNARLWQTYSSLEFGMIAMPCPHEPEYFHIMAHRLGVEALRDDGTPAELGEPGQIYVTDYFNFQAPLIRYELGDLIVRGQCPCGKTPLPAISKILGRVANRLLKRDGTRMLFVELSVALRETPGVRQYKVIQDGVEDFTVLVSAEQNLDGQIRDAFTTHVGYVPNQLRIKYVDSIPRDPNGKYQTLICKV